MRLLIVNDEIISAKGLMMGVQWADYGVDEVELAFEARSARRLLSEKPFDIALCDIEMPGESGIDLIRWMRAQELETEVIILTCHADFEFAQEAIRLKCRNYILVPAPYETIAQNVGEAVRAVEERNRERRQQAYGQLWIAEREREAVLQSASRSPEQAVKSVEEYVGGHLGELDLSVNQIAARLYLNPDYLNRLFKRERGVSIGQFILERRMELATHLLEDSSLGTARVAELVGYRSYSAFVTAFKNVYGCAPSQYHAKG